MAPPLRIVPARLLPRLLLAAALLAAPLAAAGSARADFQAPVGWESVKTGHSYSDLIERLDQAVTDNKMGLVTRASATTGAKKMLDREIPGNMVVGVFRPDFAVRMLEASVPAGIEAPIRFYITENADKSASLSYKTPTAVFAPYSQDNEALQALAMELDEIFAKIASEAVGE